MKHKIKEYFTGVTGRLTVAVVILSIAVISLFVTIFSSSSSIATGYEEQVYICEHEGDWQQFQFIKVDDDTYKGKDRGDWFLINSDDSYINLDRVVTDLDRFAEPLDYFATHHTSAICQLKK